MLCHNHWTALARRLWAVTDNCAQISPRLDYSWPGWLSHKWASLPNLLLVNHPTPALPALCAVAGESQRVIRDTCRPAVIVLQVPHYNHSKAPHTSQHPR